jgi:hypothetical protein
MSETPRPMFLFTSTGVPVQVKEWFSNSGDSVNSIQSRQSNPAQEEKSKWLNLTKGQESQVCFTDNLSCDSRFQRAFTACIFKVITLVGSSQRN